MYTGRWRIPNFQVADWATEDTVDIAWDIPQEKVYLNTNSENNLTWIRTGRLKSNFELKGTEWEVRVYSNRYELGSNTDTHVRAFMGVYQEVPPVDPSGDLYNHNLRIWFDWQNSYLYHSNTHYCVAINDAPGGVGTYAVHTIRRRGNTIQFYASSNWNPIPEGTTPDYSYTLESDAPLYFEMAEADGTSSGGGSTWYYNFAYTGEGIAEIIPLYLEAAATTSSIDNQLDLSVWGITPPPTHMLGAMSLSITGSVPSAVYVSDGISLQTSGVIVLPPSPPSPSPGLSAGSVVHDYEFFPDDAKSILADFDSGESVTISIWSSEGHIINIVSDVCNEVGDTGTYSWSTGNIAVLPAGSVQYMWKMTDGVNTKMGNFRLFARERKIGRMPRPGEEDQFLV